MKKTLLLLLIVTMLAGMLAACGTKNPPAETTGSESSTTEATETTTENKEPLVPVIPLRELPEKKYNTDIIFLMRADKQNQSDIFVEESSTDQIEQLVWERNDVVQEQFGFEFTLRKSAGAYGEAETNDILAGERFDVIVPHGRLSSTYAQKGCLVDLFNLPYLNLTYEWWQQDLVQNFAINKKLYFATGGLSHLGTIASYCMLYNRDIINDIDGVTTPYEYVKAGNWNWSTFSQLAKECVRDMDGDGFSTIENSAKQSNNDVMGWATYPWGGTYCTFFASNNRILKTDEDGMPYFALATESAYNAMVGYFDLLNGDGFLLVDTDSDSRIENATMAGRIAFRDTTLGSIVTQYKNSDLDYGIVPFPKVDTTMDHYTSHVAGAYNMYMVSRTCADFEATAVALEALAQEGYRIVIPEYYEYATVRGSRDEENYEMVLLVDQSRFYDFGYYWSPFGTMSGYFQYLAQTHSADTFYSKYQSLVDSGDAQKKLNDLLELFS